MPPCRQLILSSAVGLLTLIGVTQMKHKHHEMAKKHMEKAMHHHEKAKGYMEKAGKEKMVKPKMKRKK